MKYFIKTGEETKPKEKIKDLGIATLGGTSTAAAYNTLVLPATTSTIVGKDKAKFMYQSATPEQKENITKIIKDISHKNNIKNTKINWDASQSAYVHKKPKLGIVKKIHEISGLKPGLNLNNPNLVTALHELGHAKDFSRFGKTKNVLRGSGLLGGMGAGFTMASSENEKVRKAAPFVAAAGTLPMLSQEAKASIFARKQMKNLMDLKKAREASKLYAKAWGTYVAAAAAPVISTIYAKKIKEGLIKKRHSKIKKLGELN